MRGKGAAGGLPVLGPRIIPAGAGKSRASGLCAVLLLGSSPRVRGKAHGGGGVWGGRDHPRGCGEKQGPDGRLASAKGSSPRVRGKAKWCIFVIHRSRIIPAGAGKSIHAGHRARRLGDHPRGCGEKCRFSSLCSLSGGSSPRVRGKGSIIFSSAGGRGIIPAGAGKRARWAAMSGAGEDHPRGCGEKFSRIFKLP